MKLLVLIGPTAVGKTRISLEIAQRFQCEIISGDSMQVYKGMDIGTAKATKEERSVVPHHLIDIREPDEPFSASEFKTLAEEAIKDIHERGKLPFLVGGTGLYVESLCYDYDFSPVDEDATFRKEMQTLVEKHGNIFLHEQLRQIDPESAERIHPNDTRRIIRALEVYEVSGKTWSDHLRAQQQKKEKSPYDLCLIGLTMEREMLYRRIEERIDQMIEAGLVAEVQRLLDRGISAESVAMQGLGYKEIIGYLHGEYTLEEAIQLLKRNTRRFAKRQWSWFRHMKEIEWVDVTDTENISAHLQQISGIISKRFNL